MLEIDIHHQLLQNDESFEACFDEQSKNYRYSVLD